MGSSGKKKTTMAKLARENRLRERRLNKQARKDARKLASSAGPDVQEGPLEGPEVQATSSEATPVALAPAVQPSAAVDHEAASNGATADSTVQEQPTAVASVGGDDPLRDRA
jgi:hypothetical protein